MSHFVYISAGGRKSRLYAGVTDDLTRHSGHMLVWYEAHKHRNGAVARQDRIRGWARACKIDLIKKDNAAWRDLKI